MPIPIHHRFAQVRQNRPTLHPATLRERIMAQLIDGILLGAFSGIYFALISGGELFSLWISPMVPIFLLQVGADQVPHLSDWWWGGYYLTVSLPWLSEVHLSFLSPLQWLIYLAYYTLFQSRTGQTPGKMMKGLVVLTDAGGFMPAQTALYRWAGYLVSLLPLGMGFWWAGWSSPGRCWHDRLTGTRVYRFIEYP